MIFQLEQVHFEVKYITAVWKDVKTKYVQFGAKIGPFLIKYEFIVSTWHLQNMALAISAYFSYASKQLAVF